MLLSGIVLCAALWCFLFLCPLIHSVVAVVVVGVLSTIFTEPMCEFDTCKAKHLRVGLVTGL